MGDELTGVAAPPAPEARVEVTGSADFSRRQFELPEWMDEPCTFADYKRAAMDLARVNRLTRGQKPTLDFLARVVAKTGVGHEPLHVVDVGCASGDTLRAVARWAAKRSLPLRLTGVDLTPSAARLARECDRREHVASDRIEWVTANAFAVKLDREPDVVISSLFTHHLPDDAIATFLQWCEQVARVGWFVNDLDRSANAAKWFARLAWAMRACEMVKHDGEMSFRRALVREDWERLLGEANISAARVFAFRPGRVCVERLKE